MLHVVEWNESKNMTQKDQPVATLREPQGSEGTIQNGWEF